MSTNVIAFINKKLEESMSNPNITSKEYILIKKTYLTVINFINESKPQPLQLKEHDAYEVDYSCPDRNGFIEAVEKSV
jgi:hypothetical protein